MSDVIVIPTSDVNLEVISGSQIDLTVSDQSDVTLALTPDSQIGLTLAPDQNITLVNEVAQGPSGPQGIQGEPGPQGPIGETGPQGIQGDPGDSAYEVAAANGFIGTEAEWLASLVGPQGPIGETGPQGPIGPNGDSAYEVAVANGFVGTEIEWLNSLIGPQGPQGIQGIQGEIGPQGPIGETGPQGIQGIQGDTGDSAYEVAVANGFIGTEVEWLASLIGPQGPQGIQGEIGPQGPIGETGPQGPAGQDGIGVPVGGTTGQYLTKASNTDYDTTWSDLPSGLVTETGTQTLTNKTISGGVYSNVVDVTGSVRSSAVVVPALDVDCSAGNYFIKQITTNSTFTFSNAPSSKIYSFVLEIIHTSGTITWPAVYWPSNTAPTLTTGKNHLFVFITDDGGLTWRGASNVDYAG